MVGELFGTAGRLWRTAPAWKGTVIAAGVFSILSAAYFLNGPSGPVSGSSTAPPALPSDPASELRLADYETAYDAALKMIPGLGERCEKMAAALGRLTDEDKARGRNGRASTKARIGAVAAGDRCRGDLAASDKHFASFETAIAAAETRARCPPRARQRDVIRIRCEYGTSRRHACCRQVDVTSIGRADSLL
jgi:hypothetical protein